VEVKAGKRMRKDVYVLEVDHPDSFVHRVPEEVLEGNVRGTEETSLGLEGNAGLRPPGPTYQGLFCEVSTRRAGTINLAMHLVYIVFQCGGVDERERAPQQHLDGIGDCVDGDISTASLLLGREVRLGDPSLERAICSITKIRTAGPIAEDVVHFGHVEV
jgi:hypothetical protein